MLVNSVDALPARRRSTLRFVAFTALALSTVGAAPCAPASEATVAFDNHTTGARWERNVPMSTANYGWRREELSPASLPGFTPGTPNIEMHLTGGWPEELIALDTSSSTIAQCESCPPNSPNCRRYCDPLWVPGAGQKFATLPGMSDGAGHVSRFVPMNLAAARLVRHGQCSVRFPLSKLFEQINDGIWSQFRGSVWASDAAAEQFNGDYSASFLRDPDATLPWIGNEDGFSMFIKLRADGGTLGGVTTHAFASYAVSIADGALALNALSVTGGDATWGGGSAVFPELKTRLEVDLPAQLHAAAAAPKVVRVFGAPLKCVPAACSSGSSGGHDFCRRWIVTGAIERLKDGGMTEAAATSALAKLGDDQFDCQLDPTQITKQTPLKGVCTFRPKFRRTLVMADYVELVWFDKGEDPSPDYLMASLDPPEGSTCTNGDAPRGLVPIPVSSFSHDPEEGSCPTFTSATYPGAGAWGCGRCRDALEKGCPAPSECTSKPYHVGDLGYCAACPEGTAGDGEACNGRQIWCKPGLKCWLQRNPEHLEILREVCSSAPKGPVRDLTTGVYWLNDCAYDPQSGACL